MLHVLFSGYFLTLVWWILLILHYQNLGIWYLLSESSCHCSLIALGWVLILLYFMYCLLSSWWPLLPPLPLETHADYLKMVYFLHSLHFLPYAGPLSLQVPCTTMIAVFHCFLFIHNLPSLPTLSMLLSISLNWVKFFNAPNIVYQYFLHVCASTLWAHIHTCWICS